jgi:Pre ATP-grasp domain/PGM1 C-terminal domain
MARLLISNLGRLITGTDQGRYPLGGPAAFREPYRRYLRVQAHRSLWFAEPGDVVLVPEPVDEQFRRYVADVRGFSPDAMEIVVPDSAPACFDAWLLRHLRQAIDRNGVDGVWPYYFDRSVCELIDRLGVPVDPAMYAYAAQGGVERLNSKAEFRILATRAEVPLAPGRIVTDPETLAAEVWRTVAGGSNAIVKEDCHVGGLGNEIVSAAHGVRPIGARGVSVCRDEREVRAFTDRLWNAGEGKRPRRFVVERYAPDSRSIYAGLSIGDTTASVYGIGEMRMTPIINGLVAYGPAARLPGFDDFVSSAVRLGQSVQALGYRGQLSVDGVVTPSGPMFLTEFNARSGGATHNHCLLRRMVDPAGMGDRLLLDRRRCDLPPLAMVVAALHSAGLLYDAASRTGVLVTVHDGGAGQQTGELCVAATDLSTAEEIEAAAEVVITAAGGTVAPVGDVRTSGTEDLAVGG